MSEQLFTHLQEQLHQVNDLPEVKAAVILLISRNPQPSILYTRRALHLRNHPGEICFPGGMREHQDEHLWATALRETEEEIGLPESEITYLGSLAPAVTRAGIQVIPFVASFNNAYPLQPAMSELDTIFHVPLIGFQSDLKVADDQFEHNGHKYQFPVYQYQQHRIWGFTAGITERLLKILLQD